MLEKLFTSSVRLKLLEIFLSHQDAKYYQRQLERLLNVSVRSLQLELNNLIELGLLKRENDGNRAYYSIDKNFPLIQELEALILKGVFFIDEFTNVISDKNISLAFIYGSAAKSDLSTESDIDLFIVGNIDALKIHKTIKTIEDKFSRVINYVIYSTTELRKKAKNKSGFVTNVLHSDKIFIKGTEDELKKIIKR